MDRAFVVIQWIQCSDGVQVRGSRLLDRAFTVTAEDCKPFKQQLPAPPAHLMFKQQLPGESEAAPPHVAAEVFPKVDYVVQAAEASLELKKAQAELSRQELELKTAQAQLLNPAPLYASFQELELKKAQIKARDELSRQMDLELAEFGL